MKKKNMILGLGVWSAFFFIAPFAFAQHTDLKTLTLHESLGEIIETQENLRYNIFGEITGLVAAKVYQVHADEHQLHILRNVQGRAQVLIIDLAFEILSALRSNLVKRINAASAAELRFDQALYPIDVSRWMEKSINKKIVLRDGNELIVTFQQVQHDTLLVQTPGGLQIPVPDISIAEVIDLQGEIRDRAYIRNDPNTSRLFFAPTGRALEAGNGYFADYYVFFPTLAYGLTNHFSLSGGMSLFPGAESQLLYFAPKFTWHASPKLGFGAGFLYLAIPEEDDLNLGYAVTTIGNDRSAITIGTGIPLNSDITANPIFLIGGETQISNSAKLISENWIFTGKDGTVVFSGGVRFFGDRLAVDLALFSAGEAFEDGGFPFLPWVDFSVFFGK